MEIKRYINGTEIFPVEIKTRAVECPAITRAIKAVNRRRAADGRSEGTGTAGGT